MGVSNSLESHTHVESTKREIYASEKRTKLSQTTASTGIASSCWPAALACSTSAFIASRSTFIAPAQACLSSWRPWQNGGKLIAWLRRSSFETVSQQANSLSASRRFAPVLPWSLSNDTTERFARSKDCSSPGKDYHSAHNARPIKSSCMGTRSHNGVAGLPRRG